DPGSRAGLHGATGPGSAVAMGWAVVVDAAGRAWDRWEAFDDGVRRDKARRERLAMIAVGTAAGVVVVALLVVLIAAGGDDGRPRAATSPAGRAGTAPATQPAAPAASPTASTSPAI